MNEKKGLVPRLRFPEFREAGEWVKSHLGNKEIASFVRDRTPLEKLTLESYVSTENLLPDYGDVTFSAKLPSAGSFTRFKKGDILISNIRPYLKKVWFATKDGGASNDIIVVRAKSEIGAAFLAYLLKNDYFINYIMKGAKGVKMPRGDMSLIRKYPVAVPESAKEQQKITDCLSSLDALITAQADKLNALKTHKKGLMQQLFPREGETVPRLRFPEFREAGGWQTKKAKFLFNNRVERGIDGLPIYSVTMNEGLAKRDSLDRKIDDISQSSGNKKVHKHDIAYNMMRMWQGASGVAVEDCMVSPAYVVLAPTNAVYAEFYSYFLKRPESLQMLTANSQGLTKDRLRLYYKDFAQIPLPYPSLNEQKKIADCLSSLDALIAAQADKLDALKTHKKGLMQQLFPSPEADIG